MVLRVVGSGGFWGVLRIYGFRVLGVKRFRVLGIEGFWV